MNIFKLIAIVVILAGTQGLLYGGYTHFNGDRQSIVDATEELMPSDAAVTTQIWAGLGAMAAGSALFLYGVKHRRPSKHRQLITLRRTRPSPASRITPNPEAVLCQRESAILAHERRGHSADGLSALLKNQENTNENSQL